MRMKQIVIFGSTGSVGTKALQICERNPESFKVIGLSTNTNIKNFGANQSIPSALRRDYRRQRKERIYQVQTAFRAGFVH